MQAKRSSNAPQSFILQVGISTSQVPCLSSMEHLSSYCLPCTMAKDSVNEQQYITQIYILLVTGCFCMRLIQTG